MTDRTRYRWATVKVVGRASCSGSETDVMVLGTAGPEAVQNTGLTRFRQPRFLDITYTLGYVWWFLPGATCSFSTGPALESVWVDARDVEEMSFSRGPGV
jgi:hypothetical protein